MLSNTNAITESWMTHRKAAEIKELEIPRRYTEDSTASKATNERAKTTLDQLRSGCFPPGVLSMRPTDSYVGQRIQEGEIFSRVLGYRVLWELDRWTCWTEVQACLRHAVTLIRSTRSSCDITMQDLNSFVPETWVRDSLSANQETTNNDHSYQ